MYKPDAARLRRNLSAAINFAKFREEKLAAYGEMQEALEALSSDKAALEQQAQRMVCACLWFMCICPPLRTGLVQHPYCYQQL